MSEHCHYPHSMVEGADVCVPACVDLIINICAYTGWCAWVCVCGTDRHVHGMDQ